MNNRQQQQEQQQDQEEEEQDLQKELTEEEQAEIIQEQLRWHQQQQQYINMHADQDVNSQQKQLSYFQDQDAEMMQHSQSKDNIEGSEDDVDSQDDHDPSQLVQAKIKHEAEEILKLLLNQMLKGCQRDVCVNENCLKCPSFKVLSQQEALTKSVSILTQSSASLQGMSSQQQMLNKYNPDHYPYISSESDYLRSLVCDPKNQNETWVTVQKDNMESCTQIECLDALSRSPYAISLSFLKDRSLIGIKDANGICQSAILNMDHDLVAEFYKILAEKTLKESLENQDKEDYQSESLIDAFSDGIQTFREIVETIADDPNLAEDQNQFIKSEIVFPYCFRGVLIYMMNPQLYQEENIPLVESGVKCLSTLLSYDDNAPSHLERYVTQLEKKYMEIMVISMQNLISSQIYLSVPNTNDFIEITIQVLNIFNKANQKRELKDQLDFKLFYNQSINSEVGLQDHFEEWLEQKQQLKDPNESFVNENFTLVNYPWLLDTQSKSDILIMDSRIKMKGEMDKELLNNLFSSMALDNQFPFLNFEIRRQFIVEDSLNELVKDNLNFRKTLKIKFVGEPGVDEGGVQKEFFQLLIKQLFDPSYGMFNYKEDSRVYWFNGKTFESKIKFELIGILMGLAIYNAIILDLHLPMAAYKKLLGIQPDLEDLAEYMPTEAKSLQYILDCEDADLEETLYQNFTVAEDNYGQHEVYELIPDGKELYVNQDNKEMYVQLMVDYIFNQQCEDQFEAFKKGFMRTQSQDIIELFNASELELLICGSKVMDFKELEKTARYVDGYTEASPVVGWFWEIIHEEMDEVQRKKFLQFSTGSDRCPINGLSNLSFFIGRNGPDTDRLPTAHTCFNHLLLPEYSSKDKLKIKLLTAIQNSEGFGMI